MSTFLPMWVDEWRLDVMRPEVNAIKFNSLWRIEEVKDKFRACHNILFNELAID